MSWAIIRAICWMLILTCSAWGQEKALKLSIRREWEGARSSAPLSLRAFAKWQKSELLEGHLQVQAFVDTKRVSRWTSQDIALSDSEQFAWMMTPRPVLSFYNRFALETALIGNRPGLELEMLDIEVPVHGRRVMVVALIVEHGTTTPAGLGSQDSQTAFEATLSLQNFVTVEEAANLHLHLSRVAPPDFPDEPLRLLGLDAVMVPHDMVGRLRSSQWDSLTRWLRAGGSMLLIQAGQLGEDGQNRIRDITLAPWSRQAMNDRQLPSNLSVFDVGMGQLLVIDGKMDGALDGWRRTSGLMLRLRQERIEELVNRQELRTADKKADRYSFRTNLEPTGRIKLSDKNRQDTLPDILMPDSIRGMPFWLAATVLGLCLICIGPIDYWGLGLLKKRRWTWALFPLVAIGFTGWMAQLAAEHNGRNDIRHWLSIVDVTPEGEVLRTSRLELTYGSSSRVITHSLAHQWWCDLRNEDLEPHQDQDRLQVRDLGERSEYAGAVPVQYAVSEPVRQWAIRMQRVTTLGPDPALAEFQIPHLDWSAIRAVLPNPRLERPDYSKAQTLIDQQIPGAMWAFHDPGDQPIRWQTKSMDQHSAKFHAIAGSVLPNLLTANPQANIYFLQTELSPTAGPDCEDIPLTSRRVGLILQEPTSGCYLLTRVIFPHED